MGQATREHSMDTHSYKRMGHSTTKSISDTLPQSHNPDTDPSTNQAKYHQASACFNLSGISSSGPHVVRLTLPNYFTFFIKKKRKMLNAFIPVSIQVVGSRELFFHPLNNDC